MDFAILFAVALLAGLGWSTGIVVYKTALKSADISFVAALTSFYPVAALVLGICQGRKK